MIEEIANPMNSTNDFGTNGLAHPPRNPDRTDRKDARIDALVAEVERLREALRAPDGRVQQLDTDQPEPAVKTNRRPLAGVRVHPMKMLLLLCLLAFLAVAGRTTWRYLQSYESTDDSQIDGHIHSISARINGSIERVLVEDNQHVKKGQLLVQIDPRDYQVALEQARANLSQALADVNVARQQYQGARATLNATEADNFKAQRDAHRYQTLLKEAVVAQQEYDQFMAIARADAAKVSADRAAADSALRMIASKEAAAHAAQAGVDQALLNLGYSRIYAPADGIVGKKTVESGQRVQPGESLLAVVDVDDLWVTANFKENQLAQMRRGQPVTIHVDAFGRNYKGYVEHMPGATGERFSLLPPENATGNYVKVVQRLPVRIRLDSDQDPEHRLRPGMSVEPTVWLERAVDANVHDSGRSQGAAG